MPIRIRVPAETPEQWKAPIPKGPAFAAPGRVRKIAIVGGAPSRKFVPWNDPSWEIWAHASARGFCKREPDLLFDLHPPELWRNPKKKYWDTSYHQWLQRNHIPILMQERYEDVPASSRYPIEQVLTEFTRRYFTNHVAYMVALALQEGVTHIAIYGCDYDFQSEYGAQRGCAEYWIGLAEGRGVQVLLPPDCDLCGRPKLLYGYESHPNGVRHPSYLIQMGVLPNYKPEKGHKPAEESFNVRELVPADAPNAPKLMDIGVPPALERRDTLPQAEALATLQAKVEARDKPKSKGKKPKTAKP